MKFYKLTLFVFCKNSIFNILSLNLSRDYNQNLKNVAKLVSYKKFDCSDEFVFKKEKLVTGSQEFSIFVQLNNKLSINFQMVQKDEKYQSKFINLFTDIFINSTLNAYLHVILNLLQYLIIFGILLQQEIFNINERDFGNNHFISVLVVLILVFQSIMVGMMIFLLWFRKNEDFKNVYILQYEGYVSQKVKQILGLLLIIYRKTLVLIVIQISIWVLVDITQTVSLSWICTIINVFLFVPIYLLSGVIFASKIAFLPKVVSFGYNINLETLIFLYLPLMIIVNLFAPQATPFLNIVFVALCLSTIYIRPLILYRQNKIALLGVGLVIGLLAVSAILKALEIQTIHKPNYFLIIVGSLMVTWIVVKFAQKRMSSILLSKPQNSFLNKLNTWNKDEIIFYHFINYETQHYSIFLYLVQELQNLRSKKIIQKEGSQKCIIEQHQNDNANKESIQLVQKIIQSLKSTSFKDPLLQKLLNQFIFLKYKSLYNPKLLLELNLGKSELQQKISHTKNLSMILGQILLLDENNLRKSYYFMKIHQKLLSKIDSLSFINKIEVYSLIQIVQKALKFQTNTQKEYNLKAEKYFAFQQTYEQLKNLILKACQHKIDFWQQNLLYDPNSKKIHHKIQQNHNVYTKIQSITLEITNQFKTKGPIILYDLIASYTTKILNIQINSSLIPFSSLIKKYKQQLINEQKQGAFLQNSTNRKYSLLQNIGVCLVDLQTSQGKILWGNQYFWTDFYYQNTKESQQLAKTQNCNFVFDLMVPELRFRHKSYFKLFTESQKLNHQHDLSFVFQSDTKIIDRVSTEIQIFPSFKNGFNVTVFLFKNLHNQGENEKFSILVKEDMSIIGYTEDFLRHKSYLTQGEYKKVLMDQENREYLCEQLITDNYFHDFLEFNRSHDKKRKNQIDVCIGDSQYMIKILKIYSLDQNVSTKIFSEQQSLKEENSTEAQQLEKCIYLLQFEKIISQNMADNNEDKNLFETGQTYQLALNNGYASDLRTHASQLTSYNSNNLDKAFSKVSQSEKNDNYNENEQNEKETKADQLSLIQKTFKQLMLKKSSKVIRFWMGFTIIVIVLLIALIITNLILFEVRQELYETKKFSIKYFNELITDIAQLCIALREYNYYAFINGPDDPRIPLLISQVKNQESQVGFKLNYLSDYMNQKWKALQIQKTGNFSLILQDSYVVIANYMLSSMTYLSQIEPQQMVFPPFFKLYVGQPLDSAQVNFNEAIFNGIFVVLTNLSYRRIQFLPTILEDITDIKDQFYIYPCIIGLFILFMFIIVSIRIEKRSENLRQDTLNLLSQVSEDMIKEKIDILHQFKQNNCFVLTNYLSLNLEQKNSLSKVIKTKSVSLHMKNLMKANRKVSNFQIESSKSNYKRSQLENDTKRDLVDMEEIYDLQEPKKFKNTKSVAFQAKQQVQDVKIYRKQELKVPLSRMQKCRFLFYFLVIGPSLAYFLVMLLTGFSIDSYMSESFRMGSQIHNKKTNMQLVFLLTREAFYFEKFKIFVNLNWKNVVMNDILDTLEHDRLLQKLIIQNVEAVNLRNLIGRISHGNLCNEMSNFKGSVYYDVTFSRSECEEMQSGLLKQGLKPTQNWFLQTAIEIINSIPDPQTLTFPQRYQYLKMPELKVMKILLAYLQEFMDIIDNTLQIDLENQIFTYTKKTQIYSGISIAALIIIMIAIRYRWAIIDRHKKEITSILEIISLDSIKKEPKLNKIFSQMPLNLYT